MTITPPRIRPNTAGPISVGGRGRRITRPFEDLREKEKKKDDDDDEDAKRKHEPRR